MEPVPARERAASARRAGQRARRIPSRRARRRPHPARGQHLVPQQHLPAALLEPLVGPHDPRDPPPRARAHPARDRAFRLVSERRPLVPYVASETRMAELTPRAILLGAALSLTFGMVNSYLALKIGLT